MSEQERAAFVAGAEWQANGASIRASAEMEAERRYPKEENEGPFPNLEEMPQ